MTQYTPQDLLNLVGRKAAADVPADALSGATFEMQAGALTGTAQVGALTVTLSMPLDSDPAALLAAVADALSSAAPAAAKPAKPAPAKAAPVKAPTVDDYEAPDDSPIDDNDF